jgi:hypothetical protein
MINTIDLQFQFFIAFVSLGIVGSQNLDEPSVTAGLRRRDHHAVKRSMSGSVSLQANLDHF